VSFRATDCSKEGASRISQSFPSRFASNWVRDRIRLWCATCKDVKISNRQIPVTLGRVGWCSSSWIWTVFDKHFRPFKFLAVLDIIHAVTSLYAAAMADRTEAEGSPVYRQWVSWLWSGEVSQVIAALAKRQVEVGLPTDDDGPTSARRIVSGALTYLQNQQLRMNYPLSRKLGLPITSSHMESAIKELNYRMKGTEKFWRTSPPRCDLRPDEFQR